MTGQKKINVGGVWIGGGAPVSVQSMCNTDTRDVRATLNQIDEVREAGCEIIRLAVPDAQAAESLGEIVRKSRIPVVADIHFDARLALAAVAAGVSKIRINPGNIGDMENVKKVADACSDAGIPIRIGVNLGSIEKELPKNASGLVESAMRHVRILNSVDFDDICISLKASDVKTTIEAYRKIRSECDYPLHLGVTESGTERMGTIKSAIGIGSLLCDGIGDTIRVSLTANPVLEVRAGFDILKAAGVRSRGVNFISCPSCGRCKIDLIKIASEAEKRLADIETPITVAVMGCVVNGPGEASAADCGIAGGDGVGMLFERGKTVGRVPMEKIVDELYILAHKIAGDNK